MKTNKEEVKEVVEMVINRVISDLEYSDRHNELKLKRINRGELFAHLAISQIRENKDRIIVLIIGKRPRCAAPLINEVMTKMLNAQLCCEYLMVEYIEGVNQYVMFFERRTN